MRAVTLQAIFVLALLACAAAAELSVPQNAAAGAALTIGTSGTGDATVYVVGPATRMKRKVRLGEPVQLSATELRDAGRYVVVLRSGEGQTAKTFFVQPAAPAKLSFFAQPSRVPAAKPDVISGTAFVFDQNRNLVLAPVPVRFDVSLAGMPSVTRTVTSKDGVAWTRLDSGRKEGPAQFVASTGSVSVRRVVQQVASDPCNLRMRAQPSAHGILVETEPVRDCSGNAVPDGSIVTFTSVDDSGKSTVDARIKRGVARAELPAARNATITVAAGVAMGNEIHWGGGR
jgi:hypothetical protein